MDTYCEVTRPLQGERLYQIGERLDVSTWPERRVKQLIELNRLKPCPPPEPEPRKKEK